MNNYHKVLALFDFDGTIMKGDSLLEFLKFTHGYKTFFNLFFLIPVYISYKLYLISDTKAKEYIFSFFYKNCSIEKFKEWTDNFSKEIVPNLILNDAYKRIQWHKDNGDRIIIVSATIENLIDRWCKNHRIELVATKIVYNNRYITGKFFTKNCYGPEKVRRLNNIIDLSKFEKIYAYGNSKGDFELLNIANFSFYKPFIK